LEPICFFSVSLLARCFVSLEASVLSAHFNIYSLAWLLVINSTFFLTNGACSQKNKILALRR
jgi:hypothetical protein